MAEGQVFRSSAENGGESGTDSGERASAEGPDREKSAAERATMCECIIQRLVAKICKGPVAERPYRAPVAFSLKDGSTASDFVRVLERFGVDTWQAATEVLFKELVGSSLASAPEMLSRLVRSASPLESEEEQGAPGEISPEAAALCRRLADALVTSILARNDVPTYSPGYGAPRQNFVTAVLKALHSAETGPAAMESVISHFLANLQSYCLDTILLPALKQLSEWLGQTAMQTPWFVTLWRGSMAALEACTRAWPVEPRSWALPAECACKCAHCRRLVQFCMDPARTTLQLHVPSAVKEHLEASNQR